MSLVYGPSPRSQPQRREVRGPGAQILRGLLSGSEVVLITFPHGSRDDEQPFILARSTTSMKQYLRNEGNEEEDNQEDDQEDDQDMDTSRRKRRRESQGGVQVSVGGVNRRREKASLNKAMERLTSAFGEDDDAEGRGVQDEGFVRQYGHWFTWLGAQPGMRKLGQERASRLVRNAAAIAGPKAMWEWRTVLQYWR